MRLINGNDESILIEGQYINISRRKAGTIARKYNVKVPGPGVEISLGNGKWLTCNIHPQLGMFDRRDQQPYDVRHYGK